MALPARHRLHGRPLLLLAPLLLGALLPGARMEAHATGLQVAPTSVSVAADRSAAGLTLRNTGPAPLHAQLRVFRWHQEDGEDRLEATTDIALSPPMAEVAPGGHQLVRVVRPGAPPDGVEASYRIIVDEIPGEGDGPAHGQESTGLRFVMRYSIPLFLVPAGVDAPTPALRARVAGGGRGRFLEIGNEGRGHAQVADLVFVGADGRRTVIAPGLSGYVLPGRHRRWRLPERLDTPPGGAFKARINGESVERTLALDAVAR